PLEVSDLQTVAQGSDASRTIEVFASRSEDEGRWRLLGRVSTTSASSIEEFAAVRPNEASELGEWELAARLQQCGFTQTRGQLQTVCCGPEGIRGLLTFAAEAQPARCGELVTTLAKLWSVHCSRRGGRAHFIVPVALEFGVGSRLPDQVEVHVSGDGDAAWVVERASGTVVSSIRGLEWQEREARDLLAEGHDLLRQRLYEVAWRPEQDPTSSLLVTPAGNHHGRWSILGGNRFLRAKLEQLLRQRGAEVELLDADATTGFEPGLTAWLGRGPAQGIINLVP